MRVIVFIGLLVTAFGNVSHAQTIIEQNGKYGIHDEKGDTVVPPLYDTIYNPTATAFDLKFNHKKLNVYILKTDSSYKYVLPPYGKVKNWTTSSIEYDFIDYKGTRPPRVEWKNYELVVTCLRLKKGNKFGYIFFNPSFEQQFSRTAATRNLRINGFSSFKLVEPIYDSVYIGGKGITIVDGKKYGLAYFILEKLDSIRTAKHFDLIPPIYDRPVKHIDQGHGLKIVWKDSLFGLIKNGEIVVPIEYREGEIKFHAWNHFIVEQNNDFFVLIDNETFEKFTVNINGAPIHRIDSVEYNIVKERWTSDSVVLYVHGYWINYPRGPKGTWDDARQHFYPHLFFADCLTGEIIQEYKAPNCEYSHYNRRFVEQIELIDSDKVHIQTTIYSVDDGRILYKSKERSRFTCGVVPKGNDYYKIILHKHKFFSKKKFKTLGYLDYDTLEFHRRKKDLIPK